MFLSSIHGKHKMTFLGITYINEKLTISKVYSESTSYLRLNVDRQNTKRQRCCSVVLPSLILHPAATPQYPQLSLIVFLVA